MGRSAPISIVHVFVRIFTHHRSRHTTPRRRCFKPHPTITVTVTVLHRHNIAALRIVLTAMERQYLRPPTMKEDYEIEEKKQAAADVLFQYSKFVMACIGNQVRPCDLRLHLMKEASGLPTSLKREPSHVAAASPDLMGKSSSSGASKLDKTDSFRGL